MNQQKIISATSWAATAVLILFVLWLGSQFGPSVMWVALVLIVVLVTAGHVWMAHKAARQGLELQELIHKLAKGKTIEELMAQHPDFVSTVRAWSDESIESVLEALDENQARDLRRALGRKNL